jgi:hypothetical protein
LVAAITTIFLVLFFDWNMVLKITGGIGVISLLLAAVLSGLLVSGDRMRANLNTENEEEKWGRDRVTGQLLLFGIPNICIAIVLFFVLKI